MPKLLADMILLLRFFLSPFIHGQLRGWQLISFYLVACVLSFFVAFLLINENFHQDNRRLQQKLINIKATLEKKTGFAADYSRLQTALDAAQGIAPSCVKKMGAVINSAEYRQASPLIKQGYDKQWHDCVDRQPVLQRLQDYLSTTQTRYAVFESPKATLSSLARVTQQQNITPIAYRMVDTANTDEYNRVIALKGVFPYTGLLSYTQAMATACANCLIQVDELHFDASQKAYQSTLKVVVYLAPLSSKNAAKQWDNDMAAGLYSGDDLASYQ